MSEPKYGEPWRHASDIGNDLEAISKANGDIVSADWLTESLPDLHRVIACVNALAGLNPEAVGDLLAVCKVICNRLHNPSYELPQERNREDHRILSLLDAAIAKAEGG